MCVVALRRKRGVKFPSLPIDTGANLIPASHVIWPGNKCQLWQFPIEDKSHMLVFFFFYVQCEVGCSDVSRRQPTPDDPAFCLKQAHVVIVRLLFVDETGEKDCVISSLRTFIASDSTSLLSLWSPCLFLWISALCYCPWKAHISGFSCSIVKFSNS